MKKTTLLTAFLGGILLLSSLCGRTQDAEQARANNWIQIQQLKALARLNNADFFSNADKITLDSLQAVKQCALAKALPATGLALTGKRTGPEKVELYWETKGEYNSKGFVLERQSFANALQFDSVTFTEGKGISYTKSKYDHTDINAYSGKSYYRVKQVDIDGLATYSNVIAIDGADSKLTVQMAPNPASSTTIGFYINGASSSPVSFVINNNAGILYAKKEQMMLPESGYVSLSSYHLPNGFYYVTVSNGKETLTQKFIIQ